MREQETAATTAGCRRTVASLKLPYLLRNYQRDAVNAWRNSSDVNQTQLVLPPGSGKTVIGLEIARQTGNTTVIFTPNTAVQNQWCTLLRASLPTAAYSRVGTHPDDMNRADITVLNYQMLANYETGAAQERKLHANAQQIVTNLACAPGNVTIILDESHHIVDVWGDTLINLLTTVESVPGRSTVVALTATPRSRLTAAEKRKTDTIFGPVEYQISTPRLIRDRALAPYREFVYFTEPTAAENTYIDTYSTRWKELTNVLLTGPSTSTVTGFLEYVDNVWVDRAQTPGGELSDTGFIPWHSIEKKHSTIADAVVRLYTNGLCRLPEGAQVREQHRSHLTDTDWATLIGDYIVRVLDKADDREGEQFIKVLKTGLDSVGWAVGRRGVRRTQNQVDRILARSEAKGAAAATIAEKESRTFGVFFRGLIVTDYENASGTPTTFIGNDFTGQETQTGPAWATLETCVRTVGGLNPIMVTGKTVAGNEITLLTLIDHIAKNTSYRTENFHIVPAPAHPNLYTIAGPGWVPGKWIPAVTSFFTDGGTQLLIGTRALLGEGWDAPALTTLIDTTAATTSTSVTQLRGRALRLNPDNPDKTAHIWTVVCCVDNHPNGSSDYRRFVQKHDGFYAPDANGNITAGVGHVTPLCSPWEMPPPDVREHVNQMMLTSSETLNEEQLWFTHPVFHDKETVTVQIVVPKNHVEANKPYDDWLDALVQDDRAVVNTLEKKLETLTAGSSEAATVGLFAAGSAAGAGVGAAATFAAATSAPTIVVAAAAVTGVIAAAAQKRIQKMRIQSCRKRLKEAEEETLRHVFEQRSSDREALYWIGKTVAQVYRMGEENVTVQPDGEGVWRLRVNPEMRVDQKTLNMFFTATEELCTNVDNPAFMVSRANTPETVVWHNVPENVARNRKRRELFFQTWCSIFGPSQMLDTATVEGYGMLQAVRQTNPFSAVAGVRKEWV